MANTLAFALAILILMSVQTQAAEMDVGMTRQHAAPRNWVGDFPQDHVKHHARHSKHARPATARPAIDDTDLDHDIRK